MTSWTPERTEEDNGSGPSCRAFPAFSFRLFSCESDTHKKGCTIRMPPTDRKTSSSRADTPHATDQSFSHFYGQARPPRSKRVIVERPLCLLFQRASLAPGRAAKFSFPEPCLNKHRYTHPRCCSRSIIRPIAEQSPQLSQPQNPQQNNTILTQQVLPQKERK